MAGNQAAVTSGCSSGITEKIGSSRQSSWWDGRCWRPQWWSCHSFLLPTSFYFFDPKIHTKEWHRNNKTNDRPFAAKLIGHGDNPIYFTSAASRFKVREIVIRIPSQSQQDAGNKEIPPRRVSFVVWIYWAHEQFFLVDASRKAKLEWTAGSGAGFSDLFGNDLTQLFPFISYEFFLRKTWKTSSFPAVLTLNVCTRCRDGPFFPRCHWMPWGHQK